MANGELVLVDRPAGRNAVTGRFMKGHVPANKGKTWSEYMGKRAQKRAAKGWANLEKYRPKSRPDTSGRCRKQVIVVDDDGRWWHCSDAVSAARRIGGRRENVGRCCRENQSRRVNRKTGAVNTDHKYMGYRLYFEEDSVWMDKIS